MTYKNIYIYAKLFLFICALGIYFNLCIFPIQKVSAFNEIESSTTYRGEKKSLPLPLMAVYVQKDGLPNSQAIQKLIKPIVRNIAKIVTNKKTATLNLRFLSKNTLILEPLTHVNLPFTQHKFTLPADTYKLQQILLGYAQSIGLRSLQSSTALPDVRWDVFIWRPAQVQHSNTKIINGTLWEQSQRISDDKTVATISYNNKTLLSFAFANYSSDVLYVYLLNTASTGEITPIIAPLNQSNTQNTLLPRKKIIIEDVYLELTAQEEVVHLIITKEPLFFAHWQQKNVNNPSHNFLLPKSTPSPKNWWTKKIIFKKD